MEMGKFNFSSQVLQSIFLTFTVDFRLKNFSKINNKLFNIFIETKKNLIAIKIFFKMKIKTIFRVSQFKSQ